MTSRPYVKHDGDYEVLAIDGVGLAAMFDLTEDQVPVWFTTFFNMDMLTMIDGVAQVVIDGVMTEIRADQYLVLDAGKLVRYSAVEFVAAFDLVAAREN